MKLILLLFILIVSAGAAAADDLRIVNIRVGQGDATLIQGPKAADGSRINVLFDAGDIPNLDGGNILRAVLNKNDVEYLDYVVISHDDADHLGGIVFGHDAGSPQSHGKSFILGFNDAPGCPGDDDGDGVADWLGDKPFYQPDPEELGLCDDLSVGTWVDYGEATMRDTRTIQKYNGMANAMGTRVTIADQAAVDNFAIDLGGGAKMVTYAANGYVKDRPTRVARVNEPNERSLSFLVTYGDFDFLISGDLIGKKTSSRVDAKVEEAVGQAIMNDGRKVDVLHVNHHGANNGSAAEFLELIKPNIAIISAGNGNDHRHPRNAALRRLYDAGIYRTILTSFGTSRERLRDDVRERVAIYQNDVIIISDGESYNVSTSRAYHSDVNCVEAPGRCSRGLE